MSKVMTDKTLEQEINNIMLKDMQYTGWNGKLEAEVYVEARQKLLNLIKDIDRQARIDEWQQLLTAEVKLSATPALFNPEGLPITTSETKELTTLLKNYAQDRLSQLKEEK